MEPNETMVEEKSVSTADDTPEEELTEETDESEEIPAPAGDGEDEGEPAEEPEQPESKSSEPGWIKKRVEKAVQRAIAETESRMNAMFEQQMRPFREKMLEDEARELVRNGTVKDLKTAKELVRYRQGLPAENAEGGNQPRNNKGQFTSRPQQQSDDATKARIDMLKHQAERIKARGGSDVISAFQGDENVRKKVISGEWDFYDVEEHLKAPKRRTPAPMRSPNGATGSEKSSIASMSKEQFDRFEKRLSEGARFNVR